MDKNYYKNIASQLSKASPNREIQLKFPVLKAYEYWARFLKYHNNYPCPSEFMQALPFKSAKNIVDSVQKVMENENNEELILVELTGHAIDRPRKKNGDDDFCIFDDTSRDFNGKKVERRRREPEKISDLLSKDYHDRESACEEFNKAARSGYMDQIVDSVRTYLDRESIYDKKVKLAAQQTFINEVVALMVEYSTADDPYIARLKTIQNLYKLNDLELEFLIFTWVFYHEKTCEDLVDFMHSRCRKDSNTADHFQQIFQTSQGHIDQILSPKATLQRMMLLNEDQLPLSKIVAYLDGRAGSDFCESNFRVYKGRAIDFEQLQGENPDAELLVEILTHYEKGNPLNIFLYGVEGTGKTELSKAIAKKLGKKLVLTNLDYSGNGKDNILSDKTKEKMSSILLASYTFHNEEAILLVDEADAILNGCEKGELNSFLEQLDMPIIWISNNIDFIEASTLRRFDFSMKFERLDGSRRVEIWKSILKAQKAEKLLDEKTVEKFSGEIPVTAGGITQAIRTAKALKKSGSKLRPADVVQRMTKAQAELLQLDLEYDNRDTESHAPKYSLDVLNTDANMESLMKVIRGYDAKWQNFEEGDRPDALNILLYGAPGIGKTEFARHIARELGRKLMVKRTSDILSMYVGESEKQIRKMFKEAEEQQAILFLDEADSLIRDRRGASRGWEVSQVNEILTQMENFKGIFIAATNFNDNLDQASRRRFALKVKFSYLKPDAVPLVWKLFFPKVECPEEASRIRLLAPGDFNAVYGQLRFLDEGEVTAERIVRELRNEVAAKDDSEGRHMGFVA